MLNNILENKIVWITGGASGIGLDLSLILTSKKATVFACGRKSISELKENSPIVNDLLKNGFYHYIQCDVSNVEDVNAAYVQICNSKGLPDILINNAGIGIFKSFRTTSVEDFDLMTNINYRGAFICIKAVIEDMINQKNGFIVNILSVAVLERFANSSAYAGSKAALLAMSKVLREEVRKENIKIMDVFPGATATPIWSQKALEKHSHKMMQSSDVAQSVISAIENTFNNNLIIEELILKPQDGNL